MKSMEINRQEHITSITLTVDGRERMVAVYYIVKDGKPEMVRVRDGQDDVTHLLDYINLVTIQNKIDRVAIHKKEVA